MLWRPLSLHQQDIKHCLQSGVIRCGVLTPREQVAEPYACSAASAVHTAKFDAEQQGVACQQAAVELVKWDVASHS